MPEAKSVTAHLREVDRRLSTLEQGQQRIIKMVQTSEKHLSDRIDLRSEALRSELNTQMEGVRSELNAQVEGVRSELTNQIKEQSAKIDHIEEQLRIVIEAVASPDSHSDRDGPDR